MTAPGVAAALALAVSVLAAGCGSGSAGQASSTTVRTTPATGETPPPVAIAPSERPACAILFARLQRVTVALQTSSDLIAHSLTKTQLSRRIAIEQVQLRRSASLMAGGPVPAALVAADRNLVAALRAFSRDFGRATAAAARADFRSATGAMTDPPVVQRILAASKTIEHACAALH